MYFETSCEVRQYLFAAGATEAMLGSLIKSKNTNRTWICDSLSYSRLDHDTQSKKPDLKETHSWRYHFCLCHLPSISEKERIKWDLSVLNMSPQKPCNIELKILSWSHCDFLKHIGRDHPCTFHITTLDMVIHPCHRHFCKSSISTSSQFWSSQAVRATANFLVRVALPKTLIPIWDKS